MKSRVALLFWILAVWVSAQDSLNVRCVSRAGFSAEQYLASRIEGHFAYACGAPGLAVIDVADPAHPMVVGQCRLPGTGRNLAIRGDRVFVTAYHGGLCVVDVSHASNPHLVWSEGDADGAFDLLIEGNLAYVAHGSQGFVIYDITDPDHPALIGSDPDPSSSPRRVNLVGGYAMVSNNGFVCTYDISDPTTPVRVGSPFDPVGIEIHDFVADDTWGYLATENGVVQLDLSDPAHPVQAWISTDDVYGLGLGLAGNRLYLGGTYGTFWTIDLTDPVNPVLLGEFQYPGGYTYDVEPSGDVVYMSNGVAGLLIIGLDDPNHLDQIGVVGTHYAPVDILLREHTAYVADFMEGIELFDLSDVLHPRSLGYQDYNMGWELALNGDYVYLYEPEGYLSMKILYCPEPDSITDTSGMEIWDAVEVVFRGSYLYTAISPSMIWAFNNTDPMLPEPVSQTEIGDTSGIRDLAVYGDYMLITTAGGSLVVCDLTNPTHPTEVSTLTGLPGSREIVFRGDTAWIGAGEFGAYEIDISDPVHPVPLDTLFVGENVYTLAVNGDTLAVAGELAGFRLYDISQSGSPVLLGHHDVNGLPGRIAPWNGYYAVAEEFDIALYQYVAPQESGDPAVPSLPGIVLNQNRPNPFNPETSIQFSLPVAGRVVLEVFNTRGQLVRTLLDGVCPAGDHEVRWNGRDDQNRNLASGVYLYQLRTSHDRLVRKALLMK